MDRDRDTLTDAEIDQIIADLRRIQKPDDSKTPWSGSQVRAKQRLKNTRRRSEQNTRRGDLKNLRA
jgi:hypothetical protein